MSASGRIPGLAGKKGDVMPSKTVRVTVVRDGAMCCVPVPFDPKAVFGKVRATRARRIQGAVRMIRARAAKKTRR